MKGIIEAIPGYLYVIIGLVVGMLLLIVIFNFSNIFFSDRGILKGDDLDTAQIFAKLSEDCWKIHRHGLDAKSDICKTLKIEPPVEITEKNMTRFLDCSLLPNSNCYPEDCRFCSSEYYEDVDKILWFIEPYTSEIKIIYSGDKRKIKLSGLPCDKICLCKRECKEYCIEISNTCERICTYDQVQCQNCRQNIETVCPDCFEKCEIS